MSRKIEETWRTIRDRRSVDGLPTHLARTYGIDVSRVTPLDAGVYRVERDDAAAWVARMFPAARPADRAAGDADVLRFLETHGLPAERLAHESPLSTHDGQTVLVTTFIAGAPAAAGERTFHALGDLLGRLHSLPEGSDGVARRAGAIHSFTLNEGGVQDEIAEAMSWLAEADIPQEHRQSYDALIDRLAAIDFGDGLPQALIHPDPVTKNFVATAGGDLVAIDWTGAGRGPRAHSLAFLLLGAIAGSRWNPRSSNVDAVVDGYRRHIELEDRELAAIGAAMPLHVLVRDIAAFCMGRMPFDDVAGGYAAIARMGTAVAERIGRRSRIA